MHGRVIQIFLSLISINFSHITWLLSFRSYQTFNEAEKRKLLSNSKILSKHKENAQNLRAQIRHSGAVHFTQILWAQMGKMLLSFINLKNNSICYAKNLPPLEKDAQGENDIWTTCFCSNILSIKISRPFLYLSVSHGEKRGKFVQKQVALISFSLSNLFRTEKSGGNSCRNKLF